MYKLPKPSGGDLIKFLTKRGFVVEKIRGSHAKVSSADGLTKTTVPLHLELAPGTLLQILEDLGISRKDFIDEWRS